LFRPRVESTDKTNIFNLNGYFGSVGTQTQTKRYACPHTHIHIIINIVSIKASPIQPPFHGPKSKSKHIKPLNPNFFPSLFSIFIVSTSSHLENFTVDPPLQKVSLSHPHQCCVVSTSPSMQFQQGKIFESFFYLFKNICIIYYKVFLCIRDFFIIHNTNIIKQIFFTNTFHC
jgi:hypothetical protein